MLNKVGPSIYPCDNPNDVYKIEKMSVLTCTKFYVPINECLCYKRYKKVVCAFYITKYQSQLYKKL